MKQSPRWLRSRSVQFAAQIMTRAKGIGTVSSTSSIWANFFPRHGRRFRILGYRSWRSRYCKMMAGVAPSFGALSANRRSMRKRAHSIVKAPSSISEAHHISRASRSSYQSREVMSPTAVVTSSPRRSSRSGRSDVRF